MRENVIRVLAAILIGLVFPGVMIRFSIINGQKSYLTPVTTEASESTVVTPKEIWVMTKDEQLERMELDHYLTGVILAEIPTTYDHQALCAQAVAARTYVLRRQIVQRHPQGAICMNASCCQAYIAETDYILGHGYEEDVVIAKAAVNATKDLVITYGGVIIEATYFHCSGGMTEDAVAVWGGDYPYLKAVESPGEEEMDHYSARIFFTVEELEERLNRSLTDDPADWIGSVTYTPGGGVDRMELAGEIYRGTELRSLLRINSTAFKIETVEDGIWIETLGKGHRVGMSQTGAQAMALRGCTWQEILAHYYQGTRIDKMEDVQYNTSKISKE